MVSPGVYLYQSIDKTTVSKHTHTLIDNVRIKVHTKVFTGHLRAEHCGRYAHSFAYPRALVHVIKAIA
jgi:hypothetical protein